MRMTLFTSNIYEYLKEDNVIDYGNNAVTQLADRLFQQTDNEIEYIKTAYNFVRDNISHSADIKEDIITCSASEVKSRTRNLFCKIASAGGFTSL